MNFRFNDKIPVVNSNNAGKCQCPGVAGSAVFPAKLAQDGSLPGKSLCRCHDAVLCAALSHVQVFAAP